MAAILTTSVNVANKDRELTEAEEKSLLQMTVEEVVSVLWSSAVISS